MRAKGGTFEEERPSDTKNDLSSSLYRQSVGMIFFFFFFKKFFSFVYLSVKRESLVSSFDDAFQHF